MLNFPKYIADVLRQGGVGVIPTDTIYGIVGAASEKKTVERIYKLRRRNSEKPFIILISAIADLKKFGVKLDKYHQAFLKEAWPGPISVILSAPDKKLAYLHRGKKSLALRLPSEPALCALIKKTGPLVAPSANWEGERPARTIKEAQKFFGPDVEFYMDAGRIVSKASTLIDFTGKEPVVLRK